MGTVAVVAVVTGGFRVLTFTFMGCVAVIELTVKGVCDGHFTALRPFSAFLSQNNRLCTQQQQHEQQGHLLCCCVIESHVAEGL